MKNIKTILYIHGVNSTGDTGRMLERIFMDNYGIKVIYPDIPANYSEARRIIDDILANNSIDLIIGTSLGGFMTLDTHRYYRIAINPTLEPSLTLPKINVSKSIAGSYEIAELSLFHDVTKDDKDKVYGVFGNKDKLVNYRDEFSKLYDYNKMYFIRDGEHQIKEEEFIKFIFPIVEKIDNRL